MSKKTDIIVEDVEKAKERISDIVQTTPLQEISRLSRKYKSTIYLKREDLQEVRSYKIRGALNLISSSVEEAKKHGVVCASAGNHAQGVALSCKTLKVKGTIFVPVPTPKQKLDKIMHFGGRWIDLKLSGYTYDEAYHASLEYQKKYKKIFVHPFDDLATITGQATIGLEILNQIDEIDYLFVPIGGGGLSSGISSYFKKVAPNVKIIGIEPKGAPAMYESLRQNKVVKLDTIDTFIDGAAVSQVGNINFKLTKKYIDDMILADEGHVCTTMIDLYQHEGIIAEPAGALALSALDQYKKQIQGKKVVCILSGGNNDLSRYPEIVEKSLIAEGLKHYFIINFSQSPGELRRFLDKVLGPKDDIVRFEYIQKINKERGPALVGIELDRKESMKPLLSKMEKYNIDYKIVDVDDPLYTFLI